MTIHSRHIIVSKYTLSTDINKAIREAYLKRGIKVVKEVAYL
jgi:hypothetical protein